jgi:hypothetical protein
MALYDIPDMPKKVKGPRDYVTKGGIMAWVKRIKKADGSVTFWVHDNRDGRVLTIAACNTEGEAQMKIEQYHTRRELEKEGYFDKFEIIDHREGTPK